MLKSLYGNRRTTRWMTTTGPGVVYVRQIVNLRSSLLAVRRWLETTWPDSASGLALDSAGKWRGISKSSPVISANRALEWNASTINSGWAWSNSKIQLLYKNINTLKSIKIIIIQRVLYFLTIYIFAKKKRHEISNTNINDRHSREKKNIYIGSI